MTEVVVTGGFDDVRSRQVRFLEEAARLGRVHALLWSDETVRQATGRSPKFPQAERQYFLQAMRHVDRVTLVEGPIAPHILPAALSTDSAAWVVAEEDDHPDKASFCAARKVPYRVIRTAALGGFAPPPAAFRPAAPGRKKVIVTGCYDWLHSGHVRFFEEVAALGELTVCIGHDANIRALKGDGHPLYPQDERRYMVAALRHVHQALISTGDGWLDAEPEIRRLKPDIYAVNEDGDRTEKREFCRQAGIEYVVLKRLPKPGLPRRQSTDLRGF